MYHAIKITENGGVINRHLQSALGVGNVGEIRFFFDFFSLFCSVIPDSGKCGISNHGPPTQQGSRFLLYQTFLPRYLGILPLNRR